MKYSKKSQILYLSLLVLIGVIYSIYFFLTPYLLDDLNFISIYKSLNHGQENFSPEGFFQYFKTLRVIDNTRISNLLSPFSTIIFPFNKIFSFTSAFVYIGIIVLIRKIGGYNRYKFSFTAIIWLLLTVFLPWRDNLFVADYALNYIYSGFVTLLYIYLLIDFERNGYYNSYRIFVLTILAIAAGGWHEGYAFPTISGLCVWIMLSRFRVSREFWGIVLIYIISSLFFALSPAMFDRVIKESGEHFYVIRIFKLIIDLILPFVTVFILITLTLFTKGRSLLKPLIHNPYFIIFAIAMILSTLISIPFSHSPRQSFYPTICALIVIVILFKNIFYRWRSYHFILQRLIPALCIIICVTHAAVCIPWMYKFNQEYKTIISLFKNNPKNSTVFYDIIFPEEVPIYTLYFPCRSQWITSFHLGSLGVYLNRKDCVVVPTSLKDASVKNSIDINGDGTIYRKGNAIWFKRPEDMYCFMGGYFLIKLTNGKTLTYHPAFTRTFKTTYGDSIEYIKPFNISANEIAKIKLVNYYPVDDSE